MAGGKEGFLVVEGFSECEMAEGLPIVVGEMVDKYAIGAYMSYHILYVYIFYLSLVSVHMQLYDAHYLFI